MLEEIDNVKNVGRVRIDKDEWRVDNDMGEVMPQGAAIEVARVEGTHLVVKAVKEGE